MGRLFQPRGPVLQVMITISCSSGFFLFGYDQGVFSGVIVTPYFLETFNNPKPGLLGTINAIYGIGGAVGALICLFFGDALGRKRTIAMGIIFAAVGAILQGTAKSVGHLIAGRVVSGIGVGHLTATIGAYQSETSKAHRRGMLLSIELCLCAFGLFLAQWINYGFGSNDSAAAFEFPIYFQLVFLAVTLSLLPFLPESPRWLLTRGKVQEAADALVQLGNKDTTHESPEIVQTMLEMEEIARLENIDGLLWFKSLFKPGPSQNGKRTLMACLVQIFAQLTGVNSVTYYVPSLLITFIGVKRADALWIGGLISVISVCSSAIPVFTIDRFGRKPFLVVGCIGQSICFFIVAGVFANLPPEGSHLARTYGIVIVSFIYIYFAFISSCWLGPCWMYGPEILPLKGRTHGMGLATVLFWLFNFMIVEITPPALKNISWKFYIIFGVFNALIALTVAFFFVETKGKSLEDIDIYFAERYHGGAEWHDVENAVQAEHAQQASQVKENMQAEHTEVAQVS